MKTCRTSLISFAPMVAILALSGGCGSKSKGQTEQGSLTPNEEPENTDSLDGGQQDAVGNVLETSESAPDVVEGSESPQRIPPEVEVNSESPVVYETAVDRILEQHCTQCHKGENAPRKIDLSNYSAIMKSDVFPPLVLRFRPNESFIVQVIRTGSMPPGPNKPTTREIELLEQWIREGAREKTTDPTPAPEPTPGEPGD